MRAYTIALYLFLFNMAVAMFTGTPLFGTALEGAVQWSGNGTGNLTYNLTGPYNFTGANQSLVILPVDQNFSAMGNMSGYRPGGMTEFNFFDGILMVATAIWRSTVYLPWFLGEMGFPSSIYYPLAMGVWFVYAFGTVQFLTGRGAKSYD